MQSYFKQSGLKEIALLRKHFKIKGNGDKVRVTDEVTPDDIKNFYREYFASVRPKKLNDNKILPEAENLLMRALYIGHPDINLLLNLIVRHCLYVDQIVVVDPFLTLPHDDLLNRPHVWAQVIINRALCLCALEEWIKEEIVVLIPDLIHYYPEIQELTNGFTVELTENQMLQTEKDFIVQLLVDEPDQYRNSLLDLLERMGKEFLEGERESLLAEAADYETKFPIRFQLSQTFYDKYFKNVDETTQISSTSLGIPLMLSPIIAEQIGAFLIFDRRHVYETLVSNQTKQANSTSSLQELAVAFQELEFHFLHNVPLKKALEIRKKGYLKNFRVYLRDLWATVMENEDNEILNEKIREFSDRLTAEYSTLQREWKAIRRELRIDAATSGLVMGVTAGSAIVSGDIIWSIATAAGAAVIKNQWGGYFRLSEKMQNTYQNPLSVFLQLE